MRAVKPYPLRKCLFVRLSDADAGFGRPLARSIRLAALCGLVSAFGYGCASEAPIGLPVIEAVAELGGHWEIDYARSDSVQTQINASFREVQGRFAEGRRRSSAGRALRVCRVISIH